MRSASERNTINPKFRLVANGVEKIKILQTRVLRNETTTTTIRKKKTTKTKIIDDALEDADTEDARHTK